MESENSTDDKPTPSTPQANQDTANENSSVRPSVNAIASPKVEPPPSHPCYKVACEKKRDGWDYAKLVAEFIGLGFLILYTLYTTGIYCANKKAADAARSAADTAAKTMIIDQRAWISPHIINQIFAKDQPLVVPVEFDNTGKTPAIHVQTCVVAEIVNKDVDLTCPDSLKSPGLDVIFPQNHISRTPNATGRGGGGKMDIDPEGLLREPLIKELRLRKKTVLVYGRVDYWDVFKKPHWSTFCSTMWIMPAIAKMPEIKNWSACPIGNDIDPE